MITWGELTNDSVDQLLLLVDDFRPAFNVAFFDDVEQITDVPLSHDHFAFVIPLRLEPIQKTQLLISVQPLKKIDSIKEA